ncbi:MAG: pyruvate kinase [Kiritimatiellaeota bacterium]|nr:pyruvate kinase [Kiritimatiellota bacterium]
MKRAKIIATLGPASNDKKSIAKLAKAGVDVFRLNFSFGTYAEHQKVINTIRAVGKELKKSIAILQDLQGPKIRVGVLNEPVVVRKGGELILSGNSIHKTKEISNKKIISVLPTTYKQIASDAKAGKRILLADGKIILTVLKTDKSRKEVLCKVVNGGTILTGKGINLPYTDISLPALTAKDREDAEFGLKAGVDYMGLSFVRRAEDVVKLKRLMSKMKKSVPIISKIEKPEGVDHLDEILEVSDGIMVARGDLAVEISFAKVPMVQKEILRQANLRGKLTVVATEMLSSMVDNPRPTRAEASDVANAILDGTDAVMLSNETAVGEFPLKAVAAMRDIIVETESSLLNEHYHLSLDLPEIHDLTQGLCAAASHLSYFLNEKALAVMTHSGSSVRVISKYRPQSPVYAATFNRDVYQQMAFYHNVHPVLLDDKGRFEDGDDSMCSLGLYELTLKRQKMVRAGELLIFLTGDITPKGWRVNTVKVKKVS